MKIEPGRRVRIQAMLKVKGGEVLEKSTVEYIQGSGTMLPGLEKVLAGLEAGAERKGVLPAKEAFGAAENLPLKRIPRAEFPKGVEPQKGASFAAKGPGGQDVLFTIEKVTDEVVEARLQHPLGDKDIEYDVKVLKVTDPAPPPVPADLVADDED